MTQTELIAAYAEKHGMPKTEAKKYIDSLVELIVQAATQDKAVISGFGTFKVVHKEPRVCRNPATGEPVKVPAKDVLKFKASPL